MPLCISLLLLLHSQVLAEMQNEPCHESYAPLILPTSHNNLPFNGLHYIQLQITLLYSQQYEGNNVPRE
jgi:hypothetical protein